MSRPWMMRARFRLTLGERLRVLFGVPLIVTFTAPDGKLGRSCELVTVVADEPMEAPR